MLPWLSLCQNILGTCVTTAFEVRIHETPALKLICVLTQILSRPSLFIYRGRDEMCETT